MVATYSFLSAVETAVGIKRALVVGNTTIADRFLAETTSRIILAPAELGIPDAVIAEPQSTGDRNYDTLLATALAFALSKRGLDAPAWMLDVPALPGEWVWDGGDDAGEPFKQFIRANTPGMFLAKNILLRERDLIAP